MRYAAFCFPLVLFLLPKLSAQPLSGSYTVGGTSPDFATPQDAAIALKSRGVGGPTFFNLRPGVYTRNAGTSPVLALDTIIAGLSASNRITFRPDGSQGGNVDNVIFQIDFTDPNNGNSALVWVKIPFLTIRNITFRDVDSMEAGAIYLLRGDPGGGGIAPQWLIVEGCRFVGNPYFRGPASTATDYGIFVSYQSSRDITVRGCSLTRLRRAVAIGEPGFFTVFGSVVVEDNTFSLPHSGFSGSGNQLGRQIHVNGDTVSIRRNYIDLSNGNGGFHGIYTTVGYKGVIEGNIVKNRQPRDNGGIPESFTGIEVTDLSFRDADSVLVANNMISGNYALGDSPVNTMVVSVPHAKIYHNTLVNPTQSRNSIGLTVTGPAPRVLNNIIQIYGSGGFLRYREVFDFGIQNATPGLVCDHNIAFISSPTGSFARYEGTTYSSFGTWQTTGHDSDSFFRGVDFINPDVDLHLSDCQSQDPALRGIPLPEVHFDVDGDVRSTEQPFIGADEASVRTVPMFGAEFRIALPGHTYDIAAGKFDNLLADGLAVADWDNQWIRLYHNNSTTRSFTHAANLNVLFHPRCVGFCDLDQDGHLDVITGGDAAFLMVFWGDGVGGFPSSTNIPLPAGEEVVTLDTGSVSTFNGPPMRTVLFSSGPSAALPPLTFLKYIVNTNGRTLAVATIQRVVFPNPVILEPDTIHGTLDNIVVRDIDGDGSAEVLGIVGSGVLTDFVVFKDTANFLPLGSRRNYHPGSYSYMHTSGLVAGRFDNDAGLDFMVTNGAGNIVLLRNGGNLQFTFDTIGVNNANGIAALDYDNDGDLDLVTVNQFLHDNGVAVLLNDGMGTFRSELSCYPGFASGTPLAVVPGDFDLDGRTDIAVGGLRFGDSLFVLYNLGGGIAGTPDPPVVSTPVAYRLSQNFPNPFNPVTTIAYSLPVTTRVELKVFSLLGQEVGTLVDQIQNPGEYAVRFDGGRCASGVYFYRLRAGGFVATRKFVVLK